MESEMRATTFGLSTRVHALRHRALRIVTTGAMLMSLVAGMALTSSPPASAAPARPAATGKAAAAGSRALPSGTASPLDTTTPAPCPPVTGQPSGGSPKIMVVGDSISQGSSGDYTWRYRLYEHLVADGVSPQMVGPYNWLFNNVTNVQGDCSYADPDFENAHDAIWGQMLATAMTTIQSQVATYQPSYLLVLIGINDLSFGQTDVPGTEANLKTFLANARAGNPNIKIALGLLLPKADEPAALTSEVNQYNADLPGIASALSTAASPIVIADDASSINTATDLWDGTHPNAEGEIKIAAGFSDALATSFGLGSAYPTPLPTVPTGPTVSPSLTVTAENGQAQLSWTLSPGATGYIVYQKNVTAGDTAFTQLPYPLPPADDPWTAGLLVNGATYQYKLQACKGVSCNAYSNTASVEPSGPVPTAPTNLSVTAGNGQATLTWTAATDATGYYVYQKNDTAGDTSFTKLPYQVSGTSWTAGLLLNGDTYEYELQSADGIIPGGTTPPVTVTPNGPAPAAPTGLSATAGDGQATLSWTPGANATGYYVYQKDDSAGDTSFTKLPYPVSGSSWTAGDLENGATYEYELQSANGSILGGTTTPVSVTPTGPAPAAPTGLSATAGDGQATLSWTPGANATGYYVYQKDDSAGDTSFTKLPYPVSGSSWTAGDLENGATYEYELQSANGLITGGTSSAIQVTPTAPPPAAPTGLSAVAGSHFAKLSWTAAPGATGYYVYVEDVTAGDTSFTKLPYPVSGTSWTAALLTNGATYRFELQSGDGLITGATTSAVTVTPTGPAPAAPTSFTATSADGKAILNWTLPANATCVYILQKAVTAGDSGFTKLPYPVCDDQFTAGGLVNGATYQYEIQAYDDLIAGGTSAAVTVVPLGPAPAGPENLTATPGNDKATLHWNEASHATSYYIWQRNVTGGDSGFTRLPYPVASDTFVAGGLVNGGQYQYEIQSVDGLQPGAFSNSVTVTPLGPTPQAPGDLSGTGSWKGSAALTWTTSSTVTGYYVYVSDNGGSFTQLPYPVTGGSWQAADLIPGHTYQYQLQAISGYQRGDWSNIASVAIPLPPTPSGMTAATAGPYQAKLSWNPVSGADGYYVYMGITAPGDNTPPSSLSQLPYPVTSDKFTVSYLLTPGTYWFAVSAIRYGAHGGMSGSARVEPLMENPSYAEATQEFLTNPDPGASFYASALVNVGGGGADNGLFIARAYIQPTDGFSDLFQDHSGFTSDINAKARAVIAWDPSTGNVGLVMSPTCPFGTLCKSALGVRMTSAPITPKQECGSTSPILGCVPTTYSNNLLAVSGSNRSISLAFQLADSYGSIPGSGLLVPGAIDGTLSVSTQGTGFTGPLVADQYPSWEVLQVPHYTPAAQNESWLVGEVEQQPGPQYLCTSCYGQVETDLPNFT
jgi:GDSL-like Lipase/Acylhydrolase family/Fibronectin type III domain